MALVISPEINLIIFFFIHRNVLKTDALKLRHSSARQVVRTAAISFLFSSDYSIRTLH